MKLFLRKNKYIIGISLAGIAVGSILVGVGAPVIGTIMILGGIVGGGYLVYRAIKN